MRASAFSIVEENGSAPPRDRYGEVVELAERADQLGLDAFWIAEHHFQPGGLCPAPSVLLAAMAARTRRIRLGSLVSVLPFHEPIETAEQYALVDRLSQGRLNFGVGSGYVPAELEGFGVDAATKRERFDRALETIQRAWAGGAVTAERPGSRPVHLNVLPVRPSGPPIWVAVQRREVIPHIARRGLSLALIPYATVSGLEELASEVREYRAALPAGVEGKVSAAFQLYVGPEVSKGFDALQRYLDTRRTSGSVHFEHKVERDPHQANARTIAGSALAYIGTEADLPEWWARVAATGVDELLGIYDFGALTVADATVSMAAAQRAASGPRPVRSK